jgi:hypothetical protein
MRYTAKARMLAFDFLPDDVVYGLSFTSVAVLAGMIARADNLGRLPGEPDVLLSYLFLPRSPRADLKPEHVEQALVVLAKSKRIHWYVVNGVRYVQFKNWAKNQPGIRAHNKRSSFPEPGALSVPLEGETLPLALEPPLPPALPFDVKALVVNVAAQHEMQKSMSGFDPSVITEWAKGKTAAPPGSSWERFAHWLWNTGTRNMRDIISVLEECDRLKPSVPYAYFNPSELTRAKVIQDANAKRSAAENEAFKKADKEAFG